VLEAERALSSSAPRWLRVSLGRLAAVRGDIAFDLPLELLYPLLQTSILFDEYLNLGDQEGDLRCLVSILLEQRFVSRFLRHALSLPNPTSVCQPPQSR
jgi:hypothetical protein